MWDRTPGKQISAGQVSINETQKKEWIPKISQTPRSNWKARSYYVQSLHTCLIMYIFLIIYMSTCHIHTWSTYYIDIYVHCTHHYDSLCNLLWGRNTTTDLLYGEMLKNDCHRRVLHTAVLQKAFKKRLPCSINAANSSLQNTNICPPETCHVLSGSFW